MTATATHTSADTEQFEELRELLSRGMDLSQVLEASLSPRRRELLLRAAIPRFFDQALVSKVLLAGLPAPGPTDTDDLKWLFEQSEIESNGDQPPTWRMRSSERNTRLAQWFGDPELQTRQASQQGRSERTGRLKEAQRLSAAIARHLARRGPVWEIERLSHLIIGDPARAAVLLQTEFDKADRQNDFPRCYLLLGAVEERRSHMEAYAAIAATPAAVARLAQLPRLATELRRRYDARRVMLPDLEKCSLLLERKSMADEWNLLRQRVSARSTGTIRRSGQKVRKWIVQIEAQGGSGKTMYLRWLGAKKSLPAGIPYARLDFDFVPSWQTRAAPWLLLVRLARQLDPQIPGRPFEEMLRGVDERVRVVDAKVQLEGIAEATLYLETDSLRATGEAFEQEFIRKLRQAAKKLRSIILVLDTLEVVLLDDRSDLMGFLGNLSAVHDAVPAVRLILSGRFDLKARLPAFKSTYGAATREIAITRFTDPEARKYLTKLRGLPSGAATNAIVKRSDGLPISLSMYADLWQRSGAMTAKQIEAIPGPGLQYLAERVLKRIPEEERDVRWLLRYGVVARRFTRAFLRECMLSDLRSSLAGRSLDDKLKKGDPLVSQYFAPADVGDKNDDKLAAFAWDRLERYASDMSFVSWDQEDKTALAFHEDVLRPMRRELRKQRTFGRLNRIATEHALRRAEEANAAHRPQEWARHMRDAIHHAFQRDERLGTRLWDTAIDQAREARAWEAMHTIAFEMRQPDYVDDAWRPVLRHAPSTRVRKTARGKGGSRKAAPMITPAFFARSVAACAEASVSAALEAGPTESSGFWNRAEDSMRVLDVLRKRHRTLPVNRGTLTVLRARIAARTTTSDRARRILAAERSKRRSPDERYQLLIALAEAYRGDTRALDFYRDAINSFESIPGASRTDLAKLYQQAAAEASAQDRLDVALKWASLWRDYTDGRRRPADRLMAVAEIIHLRTMMGHAGQALIAVQQGRALVARRSSEADDNYQWAIATARLEERAAAAFRLVGDPGVAAQAAAKALAIAREVQQREGVIWPRLGASLHGRAQVEVAQSEIAQRNWTAARDALDELRSTWSEQHYQDGVARSLALAYRFYRNSIGDLRLATQTLHEAGSLPVLPTSDGWWYLNYARLVDSAGRPGRGARVYQALRAEVRKPQPPRRRVLAALAMLSLGKHDPFAERVLVQAVGEMTPATSARRFLGEHLLSIGSIRISARSRLVLSRRLQVRSNSVVTRKEASSVSWRDLHDRALVAFALGDRHLALRWLAILRENAASAGQIFPLAESTALVTRYSPREGSTSTGGRFAFIRDLAAAHTPGIAGLAALGQSWVARAVNAKLSMEFANQAVAYLDSESDQPTTWLADALVLRERSPQGPSDDLNRARQILIKLGIKITTGKYKGMFPAATRTVPPVVDRGERPAKESQPVQENQDRPPKPPQRLLIRISADPDSDVNGAIIAEQRGAVIENYPLSLGPLATVLTSGPTGGNTQTVPESVMALFADDWRGATNGLRGFFHPSLHTRSKQVAGEVGVILSDEAPVYLPIELARLDDNRRSYLATDGADRLVYRTTEPHISGRDHAMWIQRTLLASGHKVEVDGILGPSTRAAVKAFQKDKGLDPSGEVDSPTARALFSESHLGSDVGPVRVVILVPDESAMRSSANSSAFQVRRLGSGYASCGYDALIIEGTSSDAIRKISEISPDLLHIRAPLVDSASHGGIAMDFGSSRNQNIQSQSRDARITASILTRALSQPYGNRPLVVVDVPLAGDEADIARQLMLRNAFCSQLFALRSTAGVLGLGFGNLELQDEVVSALSTGLSEGESLGKTCGRIRRLRTRIENTRGDSAVQTEAMLVGSALWAYYPDAVHLPSRTSRAVT